MLGWLDSVSLLSFAKMLSLPIVPTSVIFIVNTLRHRQFLWHLTASCRGSKAQRSTSRERNGHPVACSNLAASFGIPACADQMNQLQPAARIKCAFLLLRKCVGSCADVRRAPPRMIAQSTGRLFRHGTRTSARPGVSKRCREVESRLSTTPLAPGGLADLDRLEGSVGGYGPTPEPRFKVSGSARSQEISAGLARKSIYVVLCSGICERFGCNGRERQRERDSESVCVRVCACVCVCVFVCVCTRGFVEFAVGVPTAQAH